MVAVAWLLLLQQRTTSIIMGTHTAQLIATYGDEESTEKKRIFIISARYRYWIISCNGVPSLPHPRPGVIARVSLHTTPHTTAMNSHANAHLHNL